MHIRTKQKEPQTFHKYRQKENFWNQYIQIKVLEKDTRVYPFKVPSNRRHSVQSHTRTRRCCASVPSFQPPAASISVASRLLADRWLAQAVNSARSLTEATDTLVFRVFYVVCVPYSTVCARPGSLPGARGRMGLLRPNEGPFTLERPTWAIFGSCYSCRRTITTSRQPFPRFLSSTQSFPIQIG